jgi:hypothetical protein
MLLTGIKQSAMKIIFAFIVVIAIAFTTSRKHAAQNEMAVKDTEPSALPGLNESKSDNKTHYSSPRILYILNEDAKLPSRSRSLWWIYNDQKGC